jgi:hypothetical protein
MVLGKGSSKAGEILGEIRKQESENMKDGKKS